jgi:hypothetical protein
MIVSARLQMQNTQSVSVVIIGLCLRPWLDSLPLRHIIRLNKSLQAGGSSIRSHKTGSKFIHPDGAREQ